MGLIAIAANPASGRDIRRLVSSATVYSNREKTNTIERIILAACQLGKHKVMIMPESYYFGEQIIKKLEKDLKEIAAGTIIIPDLPVTDSLMDTCNFAGYAKEQGASVLIVMGGDGTSRAAAKSGSEVPLISLSTGTNNVFPEMAEGTIVGMAASALADGTALSGECCSRCKQIEIFKNGELADIALVDAVFSGYTYSGSKAIWSREDIHRVIASRCHPASIGFSSLLGGIFTITPEDDFGAVTDCASGEPNLRTALAAGVITPFRLENARKIPINETVTWVMDRVGMIALDGEREVRWENGDEIGIRITRNGPIRVNLYQALESAQRNGYFKM